MSIIGPIEARQETWLARRDPRLKLAWLVAVSIASVLVDSHAALVALFIATFVVALALGWRPRTWLAVGVVLLIVAWGTALSQAMFYYDNRTPLVPGLPLYREGAVYGLIQSLRMLAMILAGLGVCLSTGPDRLLAALVAVRVPVAVSFMAVTALRFLPTVANEWAVVRRSCRLRGYRPRLWAPSREGVNSWRIEVALVVPVVAAALRRASTLATSLTTRGFDATQPRTAYPPLAMSGVEPWLLVALVLATFALSAAKSLFWLAEAGLYRMPALQGLYDLASQWL
ncbi:MAG: energy-coupling factor transporter transmembrane protein EcfT [Planctomycetia bacterium]|nr:energy-coupling factor transporter transmembrane protein EcfT [Planctomycetia bacterium]